MSETVVTVWSKLPRLCRECTRRQVLGLLVGGLRTTDKRQSCHGFLRDTVSIKLVRGRRRLVQVKGLHSSARMEFLGTGLRGGPLKEERLLVG